MLLDRHRKSSPQLEVRPFGCLLKLVCHGVQIINNFHTENLPSLMPSCSYFIYKVSAPVNKYIPCFLLEPFLPCRSICPFFSFAQCFIKARGIYKADLQSLQTGAFLLACQLNIFPSPKVCAAESCSQIRTEQQQHWEAQEQGSCVCLMGTGCALGNSSSLIHKPRRPWVREQLQKSCDPPVKEASQKREH